MVAETNYSKTSAIFGTRLFKFTYCRISEILDWITITPPYRKKISFYLISLITTNASSEFVSENFPLKRKCFKRISTMKKEKTYLKVFCEKKA